MATEPVTLFAQAVNPALVIDVLRKMNATFTVDGPDDTWREVVVTTGGKKHLIIKHDPEYYSGEAWTGQMRGMRGYLLRFPDVPEQARILALTEKFGFGLGTIFDPDMTPGDERYEVLSRIASALDAVWFRPSSIRDSVGRVLYSCDVAEIDPLASWPSYADSVPAHSTGLVHAASVPAPGSDSGNAQALKERTFSELASLGFKPAASLPLPDMGAHVRAADLLCRRLMALQAVFAWAAMPVHVAGDVPVQGYIERNKLRESMTDSERAIVSLPRAEAQALHRASVGWRLENMWPLAWILGFASAPNLAASQIANEVVQALFFNFLPAWDGTAAAFAASAALRPADEVIGMEYLFYCAHNAVRSAQMGRLTVPVGFHPMTHGGAIHERRHALTWTLAPGDAWDDTDLST